MSTPIIVVTILAAKEGCIRDLRNVLQGLIPPTRAEIGCINFDLHQDIENPRRFVFHETWQSQSALDSHFASRHYANAAGLLLRMTDSFKINNLHKTLTFYERSSCVSYRI